MARIKIYRGSLFELRHEKTAFCICKNRDADQLHRNCEKTCLRGFRYIDRPTPLIPKSEISSLYPSSVAAQPALCLTSPETPKTGLLVSKVIYYHRAYVTVESLRDTEINAVSVNEFFLRKMYFISNHGSKIR